MCGEWQDNVWNSVEQARHRMAPMKKNRKINLSDTWMSCKKMECFFFKLILGQSHNDEIS